MQNIDPNLIKVGTVLNAEIGIESYRNAVVTSLGTNKCWPVGTDVGCFKYSEITEIVSQPDEQPPEAPKTAYKANIYAKNTNGSKALESYLTVDLTDPSKGVDTLLKLLDNTALHSVEIYKG